TKYSCCIALGVLMALPLAAWSGGAEKAPASVEGAWIYLYKDHLSSDLLVFHFAKQQGGAAVATIEVPSLRKKRDFTAVTLEGAKARIQLDDSLVVFEGELGTDGASMAGKLRI